MSADRSEQEWMVRPVWEEGPGLWERYEAPSEEAAIRAYIQAAGGVVTDVLEWQVRHAA